MPLRLRHFIGFSTLLFASCDRRGGAAGNGMSELDSQSGPAITKTQRPPNQKSRDPDQELQETLATARLIVAENDRNQALATIVWNLAETDPARALVGLSELPEDSSERSPLIQHFAMRFAEYEPAAAIQWASTLESPEERSAALGKIALVIAESDPVKAANLISESGVAGRDFDVAVVQVVQRWVAISPSDAAAWVVLFDPSEARSASLQSVLGGWAEKDAQSALNWISTLENEVLIEDARRAMAEAALQQAENVQSEWMRLADPEIRARYQDLKDQAQDEDAGGETR